jgi:site-specific recombinase
MALLIETSAADLLSETGLPTDRGFMGELARRWVRRWLPAPRDDGDIARLLERMLPKPRDVAWLGQVPPALGGRLVAMVSPPVTERDPWLPTCRAAGDAVALIATRVAALGLSPDVRARSPRCSLLESPFYRLPHVCDGLLRATALEDPDAAVRSTRLTDAASESLGVDAECREVVAAVLENLERAGVSVEVVFRLDVIVRSLDRVDALLTLMRPGHPTDQCARATKLLAELLHTRWEDRSMGALVRGNVQLLARKIIERAGHTGEHYITSTRGEYVRMLLSAGGGGVLTAATAGMKYVIAAMKLAPLVDGVLASANYAVSFLVMQLAGFTLATKQPSMTAAALAGTLREDHGKHNLDALVSQIARITRSQLAAAIGNVGLVIPAAYGLDLLFRSNTGRSFLDEKTALYIIESLHPLHSGTVPYAALTGILLWAASVAAGWLENWTVYERLPEVIAEHPMKRFIGARATLWLSRAFARNVSGFGGNVSLGVLLGMVPVIGKFSGLPLDVRHVTLSTGALVLAVVALPQGTLGEPSVHAAMAGIAVIGLLNFGVSFVLALTVALRARDVTRGDRFRLVLAVLKRLFLSPLEFVFPPAGKA